MVWVILILQLVAAYGWSRVIAAHSAVPAKLVLTTGLMILLASGALTLVMFGYGLLGITFSPSRTLLTYAAVMLPGWWLARRQRNLHLPRPNIPPMAWGPLLMLVGVCGAALLNALLWPFYRADALGIYVPMAQTLAQSAALVPIEPGRDLYELYPQLMSFGYAHLYQVAGWENPYPARLFNTLLSLSVFPAVYALARATFPDQRLTAAAAVGLVALTPDISVWASAGYVDLPMAAYFTFGAAFAIATARHGRLVDAAAAGLCFGLAAWTKNAALLAVLLFLIYMLVHLIIGQLRLNHLMLSFGLVAIVAAPWYLRNLWLAGSLTPDTVWVDDARQTLANLFILISRPQNYGLPGWIMLGGVGWQIVRRDALVLLWWSLPYFVTWYLFASYDPRFILLFLPMLAVMGGGLMAQVWQVGRVRWPVQLPIRLIGLVLLAALTIGVMWRSVEYKRPLLADPAMSHEQKLEIVR